ncbi:MAG: N-acetylglucosamine kinase [Sphingobacteriaceae bacterium]|nr:MAG: N-acetylglucosamine kinase [Sphingobacteriaceae bacterium]
MKLIADSGSTKTSWCLIEDDKPDMYFDTEGFNPYYVSSEQITASILEKLPATINADEITGVYYYGAGCSGDKNHIVENALKAVFSHALIAVEHDLLAAARSVLANSAGFVAILGTGTNSCIYDGETITHQIDSLGFILGDEGSGAYIGKKLLIDYGRALMPEDIRALFWDTYGLTPDNIIDNIYSKPLPNRFCAGFTKFIGANIEHPYMAGIVESSFTDCFDKLISLYPDYASYSFNCVGSVGYRFLPILTKVAGSYGMHVGNVIKAPIEGLVKYHGKLADASGSARSAGQLISP